MNDINFIDLFSGAGGSSRGFVDAGFSPSGALDNNPGLSETYINNIGLEPIICDINNFSGNDILSHFGIDKKEVKVIIGCPPCQGFTSLRNSGSDPRNNLLLIYARKIKEIFPEFFVFENVPGIMFERNIGFFNKFLSYIENLGYGFKYDILNAADYGVPQLRKRMILIATRIKDFKRKLQLPEPIYGGKTQKRWKTVRDTIEDLPRLNNGERSSIPNHNAPNHTKKILDMIKEIPINGGSRTDLPKKYWLKCHLKHDGHTDVYGRLWWDKPSPTITCGCHSPSKGRFLHPDQNRGITLRESARLQSFSDDFIFYGNRTQCAEQIGNAFPPLYAKAIAFKILKFYN
jgi:DNA (cytosine-5)-methyltransferase 1